MDKDQHIRLWKKSGEAFSSLTEPGSLSLVAHKASSLRGESFAPELRQEGMHFWTFTSEGDTYDLYQDNTQILDIAFQADNSLMVAGYSWGVTSVWRLEQVDLLDTSSKA